MQRHRWLIDNIWFPTAHWCPVGPRVLDTCSKIERANHRWGDMGPHRLVPDFKVLYWGPQTSLRFYLLSCTYAMLYCFIYDCARSTLYCLGSGVFSRYRQSQFWDLLSFTATVANPEPVSETGRLCCG